MTYSVLAPRGIQDRGQSIFCCTDSGKALITAIEFLTIDILITKRKLSSDNQL